MNLKEETIKILNDNNKTIEDIKWIGSEKYYIDIDKFWELSDRIYDDGYGAQEVACDLLIVGDDFWLERHEYDGSEWWEYKTIPTKPTEFLEVKKVIDDMWSSLEKMNGIGKSE